jgi:large subunit ribosomal protein L28
MGQHCAICGKHPASGHSISHSAVKSPRRFLPNLQRVRVLVDGAPRRRYVCTSCLQAGRVQRPPVRRKAPVAV